MLQIKMLLRFYNSRNEIYKSYDSFIDNLRGFALIRWELIK